ncbi:hypothetical protein [Pseudomonas fluorescens]|jgi:hypothetical protein|uniref:hypothetical protein n=1 Tax=Pseudomonas fluorescens TaxID=294 RepID=UPI001CA7751C|nr:hypothetical protein [Pseudomonas fluorescens]MBY8934886.1 hypothetical protein [Pseudomonas fluorescens]
MSAEKNVVPVITSVRDDRGVIDNGGTTSATSVQLSGVADAGEKVEIFDGAVLRGQVVVGAAGLWDSRLTSLMVGAHSVTARGSAGTSPVRTFIVVPAK